MTRKRKCACGGFIVASVDEPTVAVQRHQATERHRAWHWEQGFDMPVRRPTVGPLTVDRLRELGFAR